jgi:Holliday junction resolvase RusA-like endonuclease
MPILTLTGNPVSTNSLYRRHGHFIYMCKQGKDLKESYQWQAKSQWKGNPTTKDVEIEVRLYFKDNRRRDWDNWHKILCDSLTGIVWEDDSQIKKASVEKFIDKKNPRIEINILLK